MSLFCCSKYMRFLLSGINQQESRVSFNLGGNNNRHSTAGAVVYRIERNQWHEQEVDHVRCS